MPGKRSIIKTLINAAIFIAMEIAALNLLSRSNEVQHFFLAKGAHAFMARVWGGTESIKHYFSLNRENERLADENFALRQMLLQYRHEDEIDLLDSLAGGIGQVSTVGNFRYMRGSIVKVSRNKQHNYLIIGQGSEDGVTPNSGIITNHGVVGIVESIGKHYSYAVSFMNTDFNVSARLGREGAVGPLVWDGKSSGGALLKEIPLQYRFQPGDTVYTSGYSSIFPADIPIGTTGESRVVNGATYEINVRLLQDFGELRYVTLVSNIGKDDISQLEKEAAKE